MKHICRTAGKSALSMSLAALLLCTVGQIALMRQSYADVFRDTVVTARIIDGLPLIAARRIADSEFAANSYYESNGTVDADFAVTALTFTNDIARYTREEISVIYADGYDEACMDSIGDIIIAGKDFFEAHEMELGGTVMICRMYSSISLMNDAVAEYRAANPDSNMPEKEIAALNERRIISSLSNQSRMFTIAGVVTTTSEIYNKMIFSPGSRGAVAIDMPATVDIAEFTVADNNFINEFREKCKEIVGGNTISRATIVMDTSKIENIRNSIALIDALYPIVIMAALLIDSFFCSFVILQSSKEAAIFRVLGANKTKTRTILSLEQTLLSTAGVVIGVCVMLIYKRAGLGAIVKPLYFFAALYFAVITVSAMISSTLVTRRSVVDLLQIKE
jgi:hypothetical protein